MTIVEFLLERISEDEEVALPTDRTLKLDGHELGDECSPVWVTINRARVLAECQAKQRIVNWHLNNDCGDDRYADIEFIPDGEQTLSVGPPSAGFSMSRTFGQQRFTGCTTLFLLALPYSTHPDFQAEWAAV